MAAAVPPAIVGVVLALVFVMMAVEARRAARNEQRQRARGGIEPEGDVYGLMRIAYPGLFPAGVDGCRRCVGASAAPSTRGSRNRRPRVVLGTQGRVQWWGPVRHAW